MSGTLNPTKFMIEPLFSALDMEIVFGRVKKLFSFSKLLWFSTSLIPLNNACLSYGKREALTIGKSPF